MARWTSARASRLTSGGPAWTNHTRRQDRTLVFAYGIEARPNFMRTRLTIFLGVSRIVGAILDRK